MKCIKKCAAYFLCICMVIASLSPVALAKSDYDYRNVADILLKTGVVKEVNTDLDNLVSRGEMAAMVSCFVSDTKFPDDAAIFSDVTADNRYAGDINLLYGAKVMTGYGDGTFRPENPVTMDEALKIFTTVLGYGAITDRWGGYPAAYQRAAYESKLTKNVAAWGSEPITYGEALQLLYNTATADMLQLTGVSNDSMTIEKIEGETLLSVYFDIYQHEGIMSATGLTSLTGTAVPGEGNIRVGGELFSTDEKDDFSEFLGYYVNCYYKNDGSERKALFLEKEEGRNEELTILAEDIENVSHSGNTITVSYRNESGALKKQDISIMADMIYNGKSYPDYVYTDLELDGGYMTLIDNDSDSGADVISVTEFETLVVKSVSVSEKKVYGVYANNVSLDDEELENVKIIRSTGEEITISDIKKDNVLSVARSKDNEIVLCIVENRGMIGTISAIESDDSGITSCVVNDNIYDLTAEFTEELKTNAEQKRAFTVGGSMRLVITHDGKIAWSFDAAGGEQYGYLLNAAVGTSALRPDEGEFLIFSQSGEPLTLKGAKKIETNSGNGKTMAQVLSQWDSVNETGFTDGGEVVQQLVKYELNSKGEVEKIYYASEATDGFENEAFYGITISASPNTYRSTAKAIGEYTVGTDTNMFLIEKRGSDGRVDAEDIKSTINNLVDGATYTFTAYDYHYYKAPKAMVIDTTAQSNEVGLGDDVFVVQKKVKVIIDGGEYDKVIGYMKGKNAEYIVDEDCSVSALEEGDAVLLGINSDGEISKYGWICDVSEDKSTDITRFPRGGSVVSSAVYSAVAGNVADYKENAIGVRGTDANTGTPKITGHSIVAASYFYLYDSNEPKNNRVSVVTADEMVAETAPGNGSRVVVASRYSAVRAVIIIK